MGVSTSTTIITIINFLIILFVVKHFWFEKISLVIDERRKDIMTNITQAKEDKENAKKLKEENQLALSNAKQEGKSIVEKYKSKAENVYDDILKEARSEADKIIERSRMEAEREKKKAQEEIKVQAVDLAVEVSSKALMKSIDEQEHRRLIKDFISKVGI
ncbi:F0F1 ATP synthase subunit B [Clostridium oceanicum]|uniref:ATP synthase subunit b n=1 Tax=Clostridium oceanicum TaxID=1543 RepID=A0ABN1JPX7_9CLOT